jgi:hypothetical protein
MGNRRRRLCLGLLGSLVLLPLTAALAAGADPLETPLRTEPEGEYGLVRIRLRDPRQGPDLGELLLPLRAGRPVTAYCTYAEACMLDVSALEYAPAKITGTIKGHRVIDRNQVGGRLEITLDLQTKQGRHSGTHRLVTDGKNGSTVTVEGTAEGRLETADALRTNNSLATGQSWPSYRGPTANMIAGPQPRLVDSLDQARLVWAGERRIPTASGMVPRGMALNHLLNGGGATPVMADDRIFLWFHEDDPELKDPAVVERIEAARKEGRFHVPDKAAVLADDVVICLDARTGALLWEVRFDKSCLSNQEHKQGINNYTPVHRDGHLVVVTGSDRLVCLDARTGQVRWRTARNAAYDKWMAATVQKPAYQGSKFELRGYGYAPLIVAGLVVRPVGTTLVACDLKTGEERWQLKGATTKDDDLAVWRHQGQEYIVACGYRDASLVDPRKGAVVYKMPGHFNTFFCSPTLAGDWLVGESTVTNYNGSRLRAFRLGAEKADLVWEKPNEGAFVYSPYAVPIIRPPLVYLGERSGFLAVKLEDGSVAWKGEPVTFGSGHMIDLGTHLLFVQDGKHGNPVFMIQPFGVDGSLARKQQASWSPGLRAVTSYHHWMTSPVVDGRWYIRGAETIMCYDLRQQP